MPRTYRLLGPLEIAENNKPCGVMASSKGCALLAYLIVTRRVQRREFLADLLWDATSTAQSFNNLRQLLSRVRKWVPELQTTSQQVDFKADGTTKIDLYQFESALVSNDLERIEAALPLYTGELLAGFYLDSAPRFNEWLVLERERLRQRTIAAYVQVSRAYEQAERWADGVQLTFRWLKLDDLDETVHRQMMHFLARDGRIEAALQHFESFQKSLWDAWGTEPATETWELVEQLKSQLSVTHPSISSGTQPDSQVARPLPGELPAPGGLPPRSVMPFHRNRVFTGREAHLLQLADVLMPAEGTFSNLPQGAVITGMAGLGKTQLAVEYAYRYGRFYPGGVYWLSFARPDQIEKEIADLGSERGLGLYQNTDKLTLKDKVDQVRRAWQSSGFRLLIFDNCEDVNLAADWLPVTGGCQVLLTSRNTAWPPSLPVKEIPLSPLDRTESVSLLQVLALHLGNQDAEAIGAVLGDLPLALQLAGGYLAENTRVTPADYLFQLQDQRQLEHISLSEKTARYSPTRYENDVARAFALSYNYLDPQAPEDVLARQLLARAACFAPGEAVPVDLLLRAVVSEDVSEDRDDLALLQAEEALERLISLGLLMAPDESSVLLHRLLAAFTTAQEDFSESACAAVEQVVHQTLQNRWMSERYLGLLPLAAAHVVHITDQALSRSSQHAALLGRSWSLHLLDVHNYDQAQIYLEKVLVIQERELGQNHLETAKTLNLLGILSMDSNRIEAALSYYERALGIFETQKGADSLETAKMLNNLGTLNSRLGRNKVTEFYYQKSLVIYQKHLAPDDLQLAPILNNLGIMYRQMGVYDSARTYYQQALAIRETKLGREHAVTLATIFGLGTLELDIGNYSIARSLFEEVLSIRQKILDTHHPDIAYSLGNLGLLFDRIGEYETAKNYHERALEIRQQVYGPGNLKTARSLSNLGYTLSKLGEIETAQDHLEQALEIQKPAQSQLAYTANTLNHLGDLYRITGNLSLAKETLDQALSIREEVLVQNGVNSSAEKQKLGRITGC